MESWLSKPRVNFTNVLCAAFTKVSFSRSFFCLRFRFVLYWRKPTGAKAECKTLMKLTPGLYSDHATYFAS